MGSKRHKLARGLGDFVPLSVNFSQLEQEMEDNQIEYEPGDNGLQEQQMVDSLAYEEMVVNILCNLDSREQLVFIFQLLRDGGYQIDHAAFAKVVNLSRRQYMRVLDDVRLKSWLFIQGYKSHLKKDESHKDE
jgi:hypothetical protein